MKQLSSNNNNNRSNNDNNAYERYRRRVTKGIVNLPRDFFRVKSSEYHNALSFVST